MPSTNRGAYAEIRSVYYQEIYTAMLDYLTAPEGTRVTRSKTAYKRAINTAFYDAVEEGYQDAGGELPLDPETFAWIKGRVQEEFDYAAGLFEKLRDEVKPEGTQETIEKELDDRSEGYAKTLDSIYSQGMVRAAGNIPLTLVGTDGHEHCDTCLRLKGKTHPASWWVKNDLIPHPGNENYICKGYQCQHYLVDPHGNMFSPK